ncbi:hypothetical protein WR25_26046 [Diploscapter pachys]|uniref:Uncharacterized protein n=1 Tax=Diploscapter pachys TaxID=2018661 RepID=A0A2A2K9C1_9BILA|nr:hypothetical protein WR25_26046 [Diploscapter pachys]
MPARTADRSRRTAPAAPGRRGTRRSSMILPMAVIARLGDDPVEELRRHAGKDDRLRDDRARRKPPPRRRIERAVGCPRLRQPAIVRAGRKRHHVEALMCKAVTIVLRVGAAKGAGARRHDVKLRRHTRHRIDLPRKLRDHQRLHHRTAGESDTHRTPDGNSQTIDRSDALPRVDKHPFPIECDRLHLDR